MGNNQFCYERPSIRQKFLNKKLDLDSYQLYQIIEQGNLSFQNLDYQQALEHYYEALEGFKIAYDIKHPSIAITLNNIALVYKQQQDYTNSLKIYNEALYLYTNQTINEMNQDYGYDAEVGYNYFMINSNLQIDRKQYRANSQLYEQLQLSNHLFQISLFHFKEIRFKLQTRILNNLGLTYMNLQDFQKSYKYFKQCIESDFLQSDVSICKSAFNWEENDSLKSDILNNLGIVSQHLSKLDDALKYYNEALLIYKTQEIHAQIAKVYNNMVSVYQQKEQYDNAFECCQKSLDIRLQHLGEGSIDTIESYQNLAILQEQKQDYQSALNTYNQIKEIRQQFFPYDNFLLAKNLSSIAIIHLQLKQFNQALQIQLQALDLRQQKISTDQTQQFDLAENLYNIGFIYKNLEDYYTSTDYFRQAINILQQNESNNYEHIVNILQNESQNHLQMGVKENSLQCLKQGLSTLEKQNQGDSDLYKELIDNINSIKRQKIHVFDSSGQTF